MTSNPVTPFDQSSSKQMSSLETSNGNKSNEDEQETIKALSDLATESFERRARLREAAGMVNGILKPGGSWKELRRGRERRESWTLLDASSFSYAFIIMYLFRSFFQAESGQTSSL